MACFIHSASWRSTQATATANSRSRSPRQCLPVTAQHGEIAFLNRDMVGADSIVFADSFLNEGAFNHPIVILGSICNGTIATCVQVTSFGSGDIMTKYPRQNLAARRRLYLAINHENQTQSHDNTPLLQLESGRNMEKQSYLHLDGFFQIETKYLTAWKGRRNILTDTSLLIAQASLMVFMSGRLEVPRSPGIASRLDNGPISPIYFGFTAQPLMGLSPWSLEPIVQLSYSPVITSSSTPTAPWTIDNGLAAVAATRLTIKPAVSTSA
nr:hypothetical protein CFP56_23979 [Quercus suber]